MVVASFHLVRYPRRSVPGRLARVPLDRRALANVPGLTFGRLLGTGAGTRMSRSADLRRWATFAVWRDRAAHDAFLADHPLTRPWHDPDVEAYHVVLRPLGAHGSWDGAEPLAMEGHEQPAGPVAVLTRATVRWRNVPAFLGAVPPVESWMAEADGLLATVGVGEYPVVRQATFSLWRDLDAVRAFAYRPSPHRDVIARTRDEGWYGEEWFARFDPIVSRGTWAGRDPLSRDPDVP